MNQLCIRRSLKAVRVHVYDYLLFVICRERSLRSGGPLMLTVGLLIAWGGYVSSKMTSVFHGSAAPKTSG